MDRGGNAMDAAAAAALACAILAPDKNGIGGYVLVAVVLEGATGRVWSVDANARAPAAARTVWSAARLSSREATATRPAAALC